MVEPSAHGRPILETGTMLDIEVAFVSCDFLALSVCIFVKKYSGKTIAFKLAKFCEFWESCASVHDSYISPHNSCYIEKC